MSLVPPNDFDSLLDAHAHPSDWVNPTPLARYQLLIVGGGRAGIAAACEAAKLGASVALVERHRLGGSLAHRIPLETLDEAAPAVPDDHHADNGRQSIRAIEFHDALDRACRRRVAQARSHGAWRLTALGIDLFFGAAKFTGHSTIDVDGVPIVFERAIVATGSRAKTPAIEGLEDAGFRTLETFGDITTPPPRLAILGSEPSGMSIAQSLRAFGSHVHLLTDALVLFANDEPDVEGTLLSALTHQGIRIERGTLVLRVEKTGGAKAILFETQSEKRKVFVDEILVDIGRVPCVDELGLDAADVEHNLRGIVVDSHLCTTNLSIFAAGSVCGMSSASGAPEPMARACVANALRRREQRFDPSVAVRVTLGRPQVARVGLLLREALRRGIDVETRRVNLGDCDDETGQWALLHIERPTDRLVGATIVAHDAARRIAPLALVISRGLPIADAMSV
ncbi:MAG TPA: FAD-dependent oxidoreductase [Pirellulales bacterium]|nr:FAD-dependent oxidoreductase [Pirellulales bacterium]